MIKGLYRYFNVTHRLMGTYLGGRTEKDIVSWLKKKTGDPCTPVSTMEDINNVVSSDHFTLVGFFTVSYVIMGVVTILDLTYFNFC